MTRARLTAIAVLAAFGLSACGPTALTSHEGVCSGGATRPIHRSAVLASLRATGFTVQATTQGVDCGDPDIAFDITSEPQRSDTYSRIQDEQGIVHCALYRKPVFGPQLSSDLHESPSSPIFHGRKASFWFANLECFLYAGDANQDRQVANFARSMRRLAAGSPIPRAIGSSSGSRAERSATSESAESASPGPHAAERRNSQPSVPSVTSNPSAR